LFVETEAVTRENYEACLRKISRLSSTASQQVRNANMARKRRPGISGRLDQLQGKASQTMDVAQGVMLRLEAVARGAVDEMVDELLDGITFELDIGGRTLPVKLRMVAREPDQPPP
jgi:hypothetical protein